MPEEVKKVKLADKPGSVVDSHSSRRFVTLRSSDLPAGDASNVIASLFGLAPDGVYPATDVATSAVSSYLAISTLPVLLAQPSAVYFLWHFPSPHGVRPLTGILLCGARTFLYTASVCSDCLASFGTEFSTWRQRRSGNPSRKRRDYLAL